MTVKILASKEKKTTKEVEIPELQIDGFWKKVVNRLARVRAYYWVIIILFLLGLFFKLMPPNLWKYLCSVIKEQKIFVSLLLTFSLVAVSLIWTTGERMDVWVLRLFNMRGKRPTWLDWFMLCFTQIGNGIFAMVIAFVLFVLVNHLLAYELALGTLTLWLVVELIKVLFHRARPYIKLNNIRIVGSRAGGHSFPSGHTSQSFFLATLLAHYYSVHILLGFTMYAVAFLVGITRLYVGMHYPRDVIGGAVLGTSWGLLGVIINNFIV